MRPRCKRCSAAKTAKPTPQYCLTVIGVLEPGEVPSPDASELAAEALRIRPTLDQALEDLREHYFGDHKRAAAMAERQRWIDIVESIRAKAEAMDDHISADMAAIILEAGRSGQA